MKISLCHENGSQGPVPGGGIHAFIILIPPQHERYRYFITDTMCTKHNWLTVGTASNKYAFDQISENFVEIFI